MKIVIVDDHPLVRKGLAAVISMQPNVQFAGEAQNQQEALVVIEETDPDLVLLDLKLADESGLDIIKIARGRGFRSKFILLTSSATREDFLKAEEASVDGYVLKEALPEELIYAIHLVNKGRKYYDPAILENKLREDAGNLSDDLTPKERKCWSSWDKEPAIVKLHRGYLSVSSQSKACQSDLGQAAAGGSYAGSIVCQCHWSGEVRANKHGMMR